MMPFEKGGLKPLFFGQQPTLLTAISILTTLGILLIPITNKGLSIVPLLNPIGISLILRWRSPFNKECWKWWGQAFG
jgi:hypothetical protein